MDNIVGGRRIGLVRLQREKKTQKLHEIKEVRHISDTAAVIDPVRELTAVAAPSKVRFLECDHKQTLIYAGTN